jgi:drug/metabolite transporter (DMT)-like permease
MLMSIFGSYVLLLIQRPPGGGVSFQQFKLYKWESLALSICTTLNITCNNASLMLIGLFVNQVIKATSPLLSMIISYFILQRRYAAKLIATVIVIAAGAMAAVPFKDPSVTPLGIGLVTIATLASSTKPVVGELLMSGGSKPKLAPAALVFYDSCFSFVFMVTFWLSYPAEREGSFAYMKLKPGLGWGIIITGSIVAFTYNITIYYFTKFASAVAVMVATNLLKVLLITAAAVLEGIRDPVNWIGIIVFFSAVAAYAYLTFQEKQAKKKEALLPSKDAQTSAPAAPSKGDSEEAAAPPAAAEQRGWFSGLFSGPPAPAPEANPPEKTKLVA